MEAAQGAGYGRSRIYAPGERGQGPADHVIRGRRSHLGREAPGVRQSAELRPELEVVFRKVLADKGLPASAPEFLEAFTAHMRKGNTRA